jgi:co-chaperonin GroES (HSP10)
LKKSLSKFTDMTVPELKRYMEETYKYSSLAEQLAGHIRFRPLGARVLVRREPLPEQTKSGLYLLGRDYPTVGTVVAVGNGPRHYKTGLRRSLDISIGSFCQWSPGFNYDLASIFPEDPDLLLLDYDQINWVGE